MLKCCFFFFYPNTKHTLPQKQSTIMPRYQSRTTTAPTEELIHLSAPSISYRITQNVCQMHLNPESLLLRPAFALHSLKWTGKKKKICSHLFLVCTRKSADYSKGMEHTLGFILLIYSCLLSYRWRGIRVEVAGNVALFIPILLFSFQFWQHESQTQASWRSL